VLLEAERIKKMATAALQAAFIRLGFSNPTAAVLAEQKKEDL
jgi:hypothetical protein